MKKIFMFLIIAVSLFIIVGCSSADRVGNNLGKQAEEFRILRRIAATNGITDEPVFEIIGFCSIQTDESAVAGMLELVCRNGEDSYSKHFLYLSDNVNVYVEQLIGIDVPQYHYQIIFAPQAFLPIPEIVGDDINE